MTLTEQQLVEALKQLPPEVLAQYGFAAPAAPPPVENVPLDENDPLSSPLAFALAHSRGQVQPYRWIRFLNDQIMEFLESRDDLLCVTAPPRAGKSFFLSQWVPAWFICRYKLRVGLSTYGDQFSAGWGRRVRDIVREVGPQYGVFIREDTKAANRWDLYDNPEGGMFAAGAGGVITGKGFHLGITDDPVKNRKDADSEVKREENWSWWKGTWITRREPVPYREGELAKMILLQTRWHFDDLMGRVLEDDESDLSIRHVDLPAIAEDNDPMGRKPGEALCPERFDESKLASIRKNVGSRNWQALYQQRPSMEDGDYFKSQWFRTFRHTDTGFLLTDKPKGHGAGARLEVPAHLVKRYQFLDPAYTRNKRSDYTVLLTVGVVEWEGVRHLLVLDVNRVQVEGTAHARMILDGWEKHKPVWVGIEKQNATMVLLQEMQRYNHLRVRALETKGDSKASRAEAASVAYENGRIWHPGWGPSWLEGFEKELLQFDKGLHDDQVDVISYATSELLRGVLHQGREKPSEPSRSDRSNTWHLQQYSKSRHKKRERHPVLGRH